MITFNRSQVIEAALLDDKIIRFNGIQQDHIYSMEINMDVGIPDGQIMAIDGLMKRFTNFVCPQAIPVLQSAVGISLQDEGWDRRVMKEIGRLGCEHFAEIIIECGRCFDQVQLTAAMWDAQAEDPALDQEQFMQAWIDGHPEYLG